MHDASINLNVSREQSVITPNTNKIPLKKYFLCFPQRAVIFFLGIGGKKATPVLSDGFSVYEITIHRNNIGILPNGHTFMSLILKSSLYMVTA